MTSDSACTPKPVQTEKEVEQYSEIDLRVGDVPQEEIYGDKQCMEDISKQVAMLQDESKSKSLHEDLPKRNILSRESSLKIQQMENVEFHEERQRTAKEQRPQCSHNLEDGFQFCKCGAGLKMDEDTISRITRRLNELL